MLVQAACSDLDTDSMFEHAARHAWIGGVIAWVDLRSPARTRERLDELAARPKLRGIRHLIHDEPDPHWILQDDVLESLALLEERRLILELPCVFPRHLGDVPELAASLPRADDRDRPPRQAAARDRRDGALGRGARAPRPRTANVAAKISGLNTMLASRDWDAGDLREAVAVAVERFGPTGSSAAATGRSRS